MAPALLALTAVFTSTPVLKLDNVWHACPCNTESAAYVRIATIAASTAPASLAKDMSTCVVFNQAAQPIIARAALQISAERVPAHRRNDGSNFRGAVDLR
jgi:hypothetical protein